MLKLREGPKMRQFAIAMESAVSEVLNWANSQINDPPPEYAKAYPTKELRRDAVQGYMEWVISYDSGIGINERIRASIEREKG